METMEIDKICRACLRKDDQMINMYENDIYQKFILFANLTVEEEIPDVFLNLCQSCEQQLTISLNFIEECRKSHEILLNYVKNTLKVESESQILLNDVNETLEVDSEATASVVANVRTSTRIELFSQSQVSEAIKDLRRSCYKNLNCIRCSFVGSDLRTFAQHISRKHKDLKSRWCRVCNAEFDNLTDHVATNHNDDYTCKFCSKKFQSLPKVIWHLRTHSDSKPFCCSFCQKGFIKQSHLNAHLKDHTKENLYKCGSCDRSFTRMHRLKMHLKMHKSEGDADKQLAALELKTEMRVHTKKAPRKCTYCEKQFKSPSDVVRHERKHTGERPYVCRVCGKSFAQTFTLKDHMMMHNKIRSCDICNKKSSKPDYLCIHLRRYAGEKPFLCIQCGSGFREHICHNNSFGAASVLKKDTTRTLRKCTYCVKQFKSPSDVVRHERTHTREKPYVCQVCGTGFSQKTTLKEHMMVHNIGPKICNICSKKFSSLYRLRLHLRIHTGEKPFVCTKCGKAFIRKSNLVEHNKTHTDLRPFQCHNCDKSFSRKSLLIGHMSTHSGVKPYKCNQCSYACRKGFNLTQHMKKHEVDKPRADRPHVCLMCNRTFTTNAVLTSHINRHSVSFLEI